MEKVWLKNYQAGVPADITVDSHATLNDMLEKACQTYKENEAFTNMGHALTFLDLDIKTKQFAAFLQSLGLKKGDRIAIMMPNLLQYPIAMFGALRAGLMVVNVNPLYTERELSIQLNDADAIAIVVLANFASTVEKALKTTSLKRVIITEIGDCFPAPKSFIINWVVKYIKKMVPYFSIPGYIPFKQAMSQGEKLPFIKPSINGEDIAYLQYTGGTTGTAKGAMLTHHNMMSNLAQADAWLKPEMSGGQEIIITALPLYHIFSLTANCLTFLQRGALNVLVTNPRDMPGFIKILSKYKFSIITGVNTLFNALLNRPEFAALDFSALRIALGGGMSVQRAVAEKWKKITDCPLLEAYGLTEACPAVCINPLNLHDFNGSIGLPISSTDISIQDDNGQELSFNQPGELCVKGPQVMKGYWHKPEETAESLKGGWLHTGDIATVDEQGFVRIVDRKKDMIVISGFNVYPNEIEDVIALMPEVREVAVVGVLRDGRELVKAFIVKKDPNLTKDAILQHCRQQLTPYKLPKEIEFREDLPKTNVGKILRRALREEKPGNLQI